MFDAVTGGSKQPEVIRSMSTKQLLLQNHSNFFLKWDKNLKFKMYVDY